MSKIIDKLYMAGIKSAVAAYKTATRDIQTFYYTVPGKPPRHVIRDVSKPVGQDILYEISEAIQLETPACIPPDIIKNEYERCSKDIEHMLDGFKMKRAIDAYLHTLNSNGVTLNLTKFWKTQDEICPKFFY